MESSRVNGIFQSYSCSQNTNVVYLGSSSGPGWFRPFWHLSIVSPVLSLIALIFHTDSTEHQCFFYPCTLPFYSTPTLRYTLYWTLCSSIESPTHPWTVFLAMPCFLRTHQTTAETSPGPGHWERNGLILQIPWTCQTWIGCNFKVMNNEPTKYVP